MRTYREKYNLVKAQVDREMGRELGLHGRLKALWNPNDFTDARKAKIDEAIRAHDLYQPQHIIGITENNRAGLNPYDLRVPPTVYYQSPDGTFGHITQQHGTAENVGRMLARNTGNYRIRDVAVDTNLATQRSRIRELAVAPNVNNPNIQRTIQAYETWQENGKNYTHLSRNSFIPAANMTAAQHQDANQAHQHFPLFKGAALR